MHRLLLLMTAVAAGARTLIDSALAGDRVAGGRLLRRLLPVIHARMRRSFRFAPAGVSAALDLEDAVQEAWLRLLANDGRALRGWDERGAASLENYVGRVAEHAALNLIERHTAAKRGAGAARRRLESVGPQPDEGADPERTATDRLTLERLGRHLREVLPERGWLVFRLLYTDGYEVSAAARALGVMPQVIYNWQHRIRKASRLFLEDEEE